MDPKDQPDNRLLRHLQESRNRFQTFMHRLIAKYNQPFEDDPLVQMSTLTYETPQGTEPSSSWQCARMVGSRICNAALVPLTLQP
ncbi:hypothetical protein NN561_019751 [Cricetulus griseus]